MPFDSTKGFEPKKALEEWKRAKPLTLQETGVGELLRSLPEAPAPGQLSKYVEIQGKLKAKAADPKLKGQSKAVKCIDSIHDDIASFLKWYKNARAGVVDRMSVIVDEMKVFLATLEKHADQPQKVREAHSRFLAAARKNQVDSREFSGSGRSVFPKDLGGAWFGVTNNWCDQTSNAIKFLSKTPPPDPAGKEVAELIKACKVNTQRVATVAAMLKPI